jgi:hypothetical protein
MKQMGERPKITPSEALMRIEKNSDHFKRYAPEKEGGAQLVQAVKNACEIYLSIETPKQIRGEIIALAKAISTRPMDVYRLLSEASPNTLRLIYQCKTTPSIEELRMPETRNEALQRLREALIYTEKSAGKFETIGPKLKRGRQNNTPELILVSYLAAAFSKANKWEKKSKIKGKKKSETTRSWSTSNHFDGDFPSFEHFVEDVFVALLIDDQFSVKNLVRLHIEERNREDRNREKRKHKTKNNPGPN